MSQPENDQFEVRTYWRWELALMYNASDDLFAVWLDMIPEAKAWKGRKLPPSIVEKIINHLGKPTKKI